MASARAACQPKFQPAAKQPPCAPCPHLLLATLLCIRHISIAALLLLPDLLASQRLLRARRRLRLLLCPFSSRLFVFWAARLLPIQVQVLWELQLILGGLRVGGGWSGVAAGKGVSGG